MNWYLLAHCQCVYFDVWYRVSVCVMMSKCKASAEWRVEFWEFSVYKDKNRLARPFALQTQRRQHSPKYHTSVPADHCIQLTSPFASPVCSTAFTQQLARVLLKRKQQASLALVRITIVCCEQRRGSVKASSSLAIGSLWSSCCERASTGVRRIPPSSTGDAKKDTVRGRVKFFLEHNGVRTP